MTSPCLAVYCIYLFLVNMAYVSTMTETSTLQYQSVDVGESVTLHCFCENYTAVMFYWYKQVPGYTLKLVSSLYKYDREGIFYDEFKNNPHFSQKNENSRNDLKISDVSISDSATYFCVGSDMFNFEFCNGITVSVKGSGINIQASVHQSATESIQPGGSVTLNCTVHTWTCDGEHSVYWFRDSGEPHQGLIYTNGGRNDQCGKKPDAQTNSCVYELPMKSVNHSHAGTYYCAVASCGHILFGNGTMLDIEDETNSLDSMVYLLTGALIFTIFLVVSLGILVYRANKTNKCQCSGSQRVSPSQEVYQDTDNLHYAAISVQKANRSRRQRDETFSECEYSSVRQ